MSLQPGDTLLNGQYRIVRLLGRGGFGFVYLAEDTLLREEAALKELIPALVGDEALLKRFLAEAKATIRLRHERIVGTHNVFSERDNYYIVMEYLAGGSLEARLAETGALPVDEAVHVATDIAEGLAYAHGLGVVHCDLKPANVLFTADGHAKIADFGIAHVPREMFSRSWVTASGFVAGTLPYMSPEQADGVRNDPRADLYAMGAVLYRMLTGRTYLEFDLRDTPGAQARNVGRIQTEPPQPPSIYNRRVPAWLDAIVLKALAKRPDDRCANANEVLAAFARKGVVPPLAPAEAETVMMPPPPRPAFQPRPQPQWFWPAFGGVAVLLIAIIVALATPIPGGGRKATTPTVALVAAQATTLSLTPRPQATTSLPSTATTVRSTTVPAAVTTPEPPTTAPTALPTEAPIPTTTVMVTPTSRPAFTVKEPTINVRAGPDTIYQIVGTLRQGETFEITGKNPAGDWWQFDYGSNKGWVYNQVVQVNNQVHLVAVASLPSTPTPVSPPTPRAPFTPPPDGCPLGWFYDPATNLCHSANATTSGLRRVDVMLQIESPQANSEFPLRSAVPFRIKAIGASTSPYLANQPISNLKVAVNMGPGEQCCSNNPYDIVLYTDTAGYIQGDIPLTKSVTTGPYTMFVYIPGSYSKDGFDFKGKESKQYITIRP